MTELRLRINRPAELIRKTNSEWIDQTITKEDILYCINAATRYSPWTSGSITEGFITAAGGHRIGICGDCVYSGQDMKNINDITSVCIRVARDILLVSSDIYRRQGSILIIGCPGSGKTTFLRDLIRNISDNVTGSVTVVDERRELFPVQSGRFAFLCGKRTDVLSGCRKQQGIDMALRTTGPSVIAVDEITSASDCQSLVKAAWCGVRLIATAHAENKRDLMSRRIYRPLLDGQIFQTLITINKDKTWLEERLY